MDLRGIRQPRVERHDGHRPETQSLRGREVHRIHRAGVGLRADPRRPAAQDVIDVDHGESCPVGLERSHGGAVGDRRRAACQRDGHLDECMLRGHPGRIAEQQRLRARTVRFLHVALHQGAAVDIHHASRSRRIDSVVSGVPGAGCTRMMAAGAAPDPGRIHPSATPRAMVERPGSGVIRATRRPRLVTQMTSPPSTRSRYSER